MQHFAVVAWWTSLWKQREEVSNEALQRSWCVIYADSYRLKVRALEHYRNMLRYVHDVVKQTIGGIESGHADWRLHKDRGDSESHNSARETIILETRRRVGFCHTPS